MKRILILSVLFALCAFTFGQGSDEGNNANNGELDIRVSSAPKASISKEQKSKLDGATSQLDKAKTALEELQGGGGLLLAVADRGPSLTRAQVNAREEWLGSMKTILDQLKGLQDGFAGIRPSDEVFFELDYRLVRSSASRLGNLVRGCADFADKTIVYMGVLPDTQGNRQMISQSADLLESIVDQMAEIKAVLDQIGGAVLAKGKATQPKKTNAP